MFKYKNKRRRQWSWAENFFNSIFLIEIYHKKICLLETHYLKIKMMYFTKELFIFLKRLKFGYGYELLTKKL